MKIAFQINHRCGRIGWGHRNVVVRRVTLIEPAIEGGFRQLDSALNNSLSLDGSSSEAENENQGRISAAHRYSLIARTVPAGAAIQALIQGNRGFVIRFATRPSG